jgi:hypothetical protein
LWSERKRHSVKEMRSRQKKVITQNIQLGRQEEDHGLEKEYYVISLRDRVKKIVLLPILGHRLGET